MASNDTPRARRPIERIALRALLYLIAATSLAAGVASLARPRDDAAAQWSGQVAWLTAAAALAGLAASAKD